MISSVTSAEPRSRRRAALRASTVVGIGLAVAGAGFVAQRIAAGWSEYGDVIGDARWGWLLPGLALAVLGMSTMGLVWRRIIAALGGHASRRQVFIWYQLGNLGKYLPGGLWPLVGRSELAVRGGLDRPIAYNSVALSMGATYLCATVVCALLLPFLLVTEADLGGQLWAFALIPIGLAVLHPAVLGRVFRLSERLLGKGAPVVVPGWLTSVGLVARHALPWLVNGLATWLVALTFAPDAPLLIVVFAGILSWVIGFVVFFVPGGIGVREAAFTAIASVAMPAHVAATVAVVSRLVFIAADALGAATAVPLSRRRSAASGWVGGGKGTGGPAVVAVALLVAAIGLNVVQFRGIDEGTVDNFDAVHRSRTGDIVEQAFHECPWCAQRFGLHLAIGVAAPGSRVIVAASSPYADNTRKMEEFTFRLYAFGEVASVEWVDYRQPPELLDATDLDPFIVARGEGGPKGAGWALALDGTAADPAGYLAAALRDGAHRRPRGQPRELVVLRWDDGPYRDLVVEATLLPNPVHRELTQ